MSCIVYRIIEKSEREEKKNHADIICGHMYGKQFISYSRREKMYFDLQCQKQ
jgi:hypothetical protein